MTKVLVLGFSCADTADGFAAYLVDKMMAAEPEVGISRVALGGLAPPVVPGVFKTLLDDDPSLTHVLFEISTSIYPWLASASENQARDIVRDLVNAAIERGIAPAFLILHRSEDRPRVIDFNAIIEDEARKADIPCLNLAENMDQIFGLGWRERHYRDNVHTNEAGGRWQAGICIPFLRQFLRRPLSRTTELPNPGMRFTARSILDLSAGGYAAGSFSRKDYARRYLDLAEDDVVEIDLGEPCRILGVSFIMGPEAGNFTACLIDDNGAEKVYLIKAFDERSYYERLGFYTFHSYAGTIACKIVLRFHDRAEDVVLVKGERNAFPTRLRLLDLFFMDDGTAVGPISEQTGSPRSRKP